MIDVAQQEREHGAQGAAVADQEDVGVSTPVLVFQAPDKGHKACRDVVAALTALHPRVPVHLFHPLPGDLPVDPVGLLVIGPALEDAYVVLAQAVFDLVGQAELLADDGSGLDGAQDGAAVEGGKGGATQDFRQFDFMSPWEGAEYVLPGDEKVEGDGE